MKLPRSLLGLLACALTLSAWAQTPAYTPSARQWWVYLTPAEGVALHRSAEFATIKAEADAYVAVADPGLPQSVTRQYLNHGVQFVQESARAIEVVSATYFALKHGAHGGDASAPALAPYRAKAAQLWDDLVTWGPVDRWTESGTPLLDATNHGWREGDIALRAFLPGAFASYDAIRYDLSAADAQRIDGWLGALHAKMWATPLTYALKHNRGISRHAQLHLLALLLQDRAKVNEYFGNSGRGLKAALPQYYHNAVTQDFAHDPNDRTVASYAPPADAHANGLSHEHSYKTGVYGRHSLRYCLHGYAALTKAARTGGEAAWDIASQTDQTKLSGLFNSWFGYGGTQRAAYLEFCRILEDRWEFVEGNAGTARTTDAGLGASLWIAFAWHQERFASLAGWPVSATTWTESPATSKLWQTRSRLAHNSPILVAETFNATAVGALPAGWTSITGAGVSSAVAVVDSASGDRGLVLADSSTTLSAGAGRTFPAQSTTVTAEWSFRQAAGSRWNNFLLLSGSTRAVELYTTSALNQGGSIPYGLVYRDAGGQDVALATLGTGVWHDVKVVANPATDTFKIYLNGALLGGGAELPFRNAVTSLDSWQTGTGSSTTQTSLAIDDLVISR